jgi:CheY-like chemotaxis protein
MSQPHALVIDDMDVHAFIAEDCLRQCGFSVTTAPTLLIGIEQAYMLLDPNHPPRPMVILIDLRLPLQHCPVLEGVAGAAHLIEQMELRRLHPAHVVAITGEPTEQRERQTLAAGCRMLLHKPFTLEHAASLLRLVQEERPVLPAADSALDDAAVLRDALRREAAELLYFIRSMSQEMAGPAVVWGEEEVRKLLVRPQLLDQPWSDWIVRRGGMERVRARLSAVWLPSAEYRAVRDKTLEHGRNWRLSCDELNMSRSTYFRYQGEILKVLADALNSWS